MQNALHRLINEKYLNIRAKLIFPLASMILLLAIAVSPLSSSLLRIITGVFGLVALWFWIITLRNFMRSLAQLTEATMKISQGDMNQKVDTSYLWFKDESTSLGESFNLMAKNLSDHHASLQDQVAQRTQEFTEARDDALAANRSKSDFVSFVSHELKLPMTSIKGYSDLLLSGMTGPLNENQTNFLTTIRNNVNRMSALVSDLSDSSRIESGRLRLEGRAVPIWDVIDEVVTILRTQITQKEQTITVAIPDQLPKAWVDRHRLAQILTNLLNNANQYTPAGGVITVRATRAENMIQIEVEDNGAGIAPEDQQKIFSKFFRSTDDKVREVPGNGLSLSVTKHLVELQGGRIWCKSEFRKGTSIFFTVPVATEGNTQPA